METQEKIVALRKSIALDQRESARRRGDREAYDQWVEAWIYGEPGYVRNVDTTPEAE